MTRKIVDYSVISREDILDLVSKVQGAIEKGWQPLGGMTIQEDGRAYQAMVKYDTESELPMPFSSDSIDSV